MKKRIVMNPEFHEQLEFNALNAGLKALERANRSKGNTSIFYCSLYSAIMGGKTAMCTHNELGIDASNGDPYIFRPDVLRENRNEKVYTEVKAVCTKTSQTMCSTDQLEVYCYYILKDMEHTRKAITGEYAFFRYKKSRKNKLADMSNRELANALATRTKSLLVAPLNLAFMVLLSSKRTSVDQSYSSHVNNMDDRGYWEVPGWIINGLHEDPRGYIHKLVNRSHRYQKKELDDLLLLDGLDFERYHVDSAYCGGHKIAPFMVTRFFNKHPVLFERRFKKEHLKILTDVLRIEDRFFENYENSSASEKSSSSEYGEKLDRGDLPF